jgi:plastocyanin
MVAMARFRTMLALAAAFALWACTPGAPGVPNAAQGPVPGAVIIEVSLLKYGPMPTSNGTVAGYNNANITVPVGAIIQFHNQDSFNHTASWVSFSNFPPGNPLTAAAKGQSGSDLFAAGWSTGDIAPNAYSLPLTASKAGEVYYGCFYHYNTPMRGKITVQ